MLDPELKRYAEYLQKHGTSEDYLDVFDQGKLVAWIKSNPKSLQRLFDLYYGGDLKAIEEYTSEAEQFVPRFAFDTFHSISVFSGILQKVESAAVAMGVFPKRPVILASTAALGLTPLARPSLDQHLLFAGHGTMFFCNYWAKAFAWLMSDFSRLCIPNTLDKSDLSACAKLSPGPITLIARILLYYTYRGTLFGFGEVSIANFGLRMELLQSMELFAIGHEVGHFVFEEQCQTKETQSSPERLHAIELFCDKYGQAVSRHFGANQNCWSCFVTSGSILFLYAGSLSIRLQSRHRGDSSEDIESQSHPRTWDRINAATENAVACAPEDQVNAVRDYLNEIVALLRFIESDVVPIVLSVIDTPLTSLQPNVDPTGDILDLNQTGSSHSD